MIEALLVLAGLLAIAGFLVKDVLSLRRTGSFGAPPMQALTRTRAFLMGLVTVAAIINLVERGATGVPALAMSAAGLGLLCSMMGWHTAFATVGAWGLSTIGLIAAVPAVAGLVTGQAACPTATPIAARIASGAILVILFVMAAIATAFFSKGPRPEFGVALFGGTEVIAFLTSPLGYDLIGNAPMTYILSVLGAPCLGFAVVRVPEIVLGTCTVAIALLTLGGGGLCGPGIHYPSAFGIFIAFVTGFFALTLVAGLLRRRRVETTRF